MTYKPIHKFGIVLFFISLFILFAVAPIAFTYAIIKPIFQIVSRLLYFLAYSIDQLGNVLASTLFDDTLIKGKNKYKFGNPDITISAVLGENKHRGTLTKAGVLLCKLLNWIDKDHVEKSRQTEILERNL
jgi:hypothetical protein